MSADQSFTGFRCFCAQCAVQGEEASADGYYVPDPPQIPDPPKIPNPPGSSVTQTPSGTEGYSGPRLYTLVRGDDWNGALAGTAVLVPYSFATRASSNYGASGGRSGFDGTAAEPFDATHRANIREALNRWEQAAGIVFVKSQTRRSWGSAAFAS